MELDESNARAHILCAKRTFLIFYTPTGPKEQKDEK